MNKDRTHERGAQRSPLSLVGLALLFAGCASGEREAGTTGTGGHGQDGGGVPAEAASCSVASDTALGTAQAGAPSIAFGGGKFAVAWTEQDGSLHAAALDDKGAMVGSHALGAGPQAAEPSVTPLPDGGFMVVWQEPGALRGARIGADSTPSGSPFDIAKTTAAEPRPATTGTTVVWVDTAGLFAAELNGTTLGTPVKLAGAGASDPALSASDGGLVFVSGGKLGFAKLAKPVQNVMPVVFGDWQGTVNVPRVSSAGKPGFFVAWEDLRGGDGNETVYLSLIGPDGKQKSPVSVSAATGSADYPDVARLGDEAAVVYYQFRDGPPSVYLSLFGPDLERVGDELRISGKDPARFPRVASGDGALGVAYALRTGPAHFARVTCR